MSPGDGVQGEPRPWPRHLVVMGLMAAGKTTVGQAVAANLGWPFYDNDTDLQVATGSTARALLISVGLVRLHAIERDHLRGRLAEAGPSVIAAAASTVEDPACRHDLTQPGVLVAWLRATPETLATRAGQQGDHRPSFGADQLRSLTDQQARRGPLFAELRPLVVDVDEADVQTVVERVVALIRPAPQK